MSDALSYEFVGEEQVENILDVLSNPGFLAKTFQEIGSQLALDLAVYPPEPPGSTYRRTNTLGRRWTHVTSVSLFSIRAIIGNNTPYAPYVQAEGMQASIHEGRWQTDEDVIERRMSWTLEQVINGIDTAVAERARL